MKNLVCLKRSTFFLLIMAVFGWLEAMDKKDNFSKILKNIYAEVKEFKPYPGESFIRAEFFIGSEDDDDTYKDIHISILIQRQDVGEKMKIQMTAMEARPGQPRIKHARDSKMIVCWILPGAPDEPRILSSDVSEKDIDPFLASLLGAIQKKKALLSLCGSGRRG